jgi:thioredoxin-related protein
MKKILISILLSIYAFGLEYSNDFRETLIMAQKENKRVLLMYTQQGCPACEYMKNIVFENQEVEDYLNAYYKVAVVDVYRDGMIKGYRAFGTPNLFFLDSKGNELVRKVVGGMSVDDFLQKLRSIK